MATDFVHLHVHSHYSLLDGACTVKGLAEQAIAYGMKSVAITDHGYMGAGVDQYDEFKKQGLRPILGCEVYMSPTTRFDRNPAIPHIKGYHLVLLAENIKGYHSLCKLISESYINGMYYKPRIDKELLAQHHEGLIALSACIGGEIPQAILAHDLPRAEKAIQQHIDILGKENFFLEIMDHGMREELECNRALIGLAKKFDLPLVATNDVHYLKKEHAKAHEIMLCIQTKSLLSEDHFKFPSPEFYFKSPDEMAELFREVPEALTNTVKVAERCGFDFTYAPEANHYPQFHLEPGTDEKEYLRNICLHNMEYRYGFNAVGVTEFTPEQQKVIDRMDFELGIIAHTKYCSYFLVVSDFIKYAKDHGIPVGPGRGSGAGSVVAYLTLITDIDPLEYDLLFERFLNPERVSPPDFDIDFCEQRRVEVIQYVRHKYGEDSVSQICTYGTLKAKAVIKDVARVLGCDFAQGDRITKLIPSDDPKMTLAKAKKASPELVQLIESEAWVKEIFSYAEVLEGINRQLGIHAAGVIICNQRLDNLIPLAKGSMGEIITEFPAVPCEHLGLLKMDFLGLRTLTTIQNALDHIKKTRGITLDMSKIPLDDPASFALLNRGDTISVFQLESPGMQTLCRRFGVENIKHIIALIAIYRPGPMQFMDTFINRKRGVEEVVYENPKMEKYLSETYGIMLYQEQIMQVVQVLAGFSLGGADILRRAIGKKKADVLAAQKSKFIAGCWEFSQIKKEVAEGIWAKIETFAGYGFNKSHSAAYAFVAYRTAFLKANYPVEFMTAVLTSEIDNAEKISFLMNACRGMGIDVLPPDINTSDIKFSVDNGAIRFGLGAIKGCGEAAATRIIQAREEGGPFKNFTDFCERCGDAVNSRMIEHFTRAGAFDKLGLRRSQIIAVADATMRYAQSRAKDHAAGQGSLFDMLSEEEQEDICGVPIPDIPEFDTAEILKSEKELLGFYVTGHPLDIYRPAVKAFTSCKLIHVDERVYNTYIRVAGLITAVTKRFSKNGGNPYFILGFEDVDREIEVMAYDKVNKLLAEKGLELQVGMAVAITMEVSMRREEGPPQFIAENVELLEPMMEAPENEVMIDLFESEVTESMLKKLHARLNQERGGSKVTLCLVCGNDRRIVFIDCKNTYVQFNKQMLADLEAIVGKKRVRLRVPHFVPPVKQRYWKRNNAGVTASA